MCQAAGVSVQMSPRARLYPSQAVYVSMHNARRYACVFHHMYAKHTVARSIMSATTSTHQANKQRVLDRLDKTIRVREYAYACPPSSPSAKTHTRTQTHTMRHTKTYMQVLKRRKKKDEREGAHHDALKSDERQEAPAIDVA